MSLGVAIFASVVLILALYHKGFRKVVLRTGGIAVALALLAVEFRRVVVEVFFDSAQGFEN